MGLFDFLSKTKKDDSYIELGTTGLEQNFGKISDEWLRELKGDKKYKTYKEMAENDATISGILYIIKTLLSSTKYKIIAVEEEKEAINDAKFVDSCFNDMSFTFRDFIDEILTMLELGFSIFETVYKIRRGQNEKDGKYRSNYSDGKIGWRKFAFRGQETVYEWLFDDAGGINGFIQQDIYKGFKQVTIPIQKCLLFRTTTRKNSPEGNSLLRGAYRSWDIKRKIENIEAIGIERDLVGIPVMHVPSAIMKSTATAEEKSTFELAKRTVVNLRNDEQSGAVLPSDTDEKGHKQYELTLLTTGGTRAFDTDKIVRRYEERIAISLCADFLLLGSGTSGSWALSTNKTEMFVMSLKNFSDKIAEVINKFAIPRLFEINGDRREAYPYLEFDCVGKADVVKLTTALQALSASGMVIFPDPKIESQVLEMLGIKGMEEDIL